MRLAEPAEWQADHAPRVRPETYPGAWPTSSILLAGDQHFPMHLRPGRRLGQARLLHCEHLPGEQVASEPELPLNYALARYNVAPTDQRTPVLSVGSNASPAQLRHKFLDTGVSLVIPLVEATVEGLAAGLAPDVSWYGTVPGTPMVGPDLVDTLFVQWLDARQLAVIDATEVGYHRVLLPAGDPTNGGVRIRLPSGEVLGACYTYVSSRGVLAAPPPAESGRSAPTTMLVDGDPLWRLPRDGPPLTTNGSGHDRQGALLSALLDRSARLRQLMGDRDSWYRRIGQPGMADQVRRAFQAEGWVRQQSGLVAAGTPVPGPVAVYGQILPAQALDEQTWRVIPSSDDIVDRHGQAVVRVTPAVAEALGHPEHVAVKPSAATPGSDLERLEAIARVLVDEAAGAGYVASSPALDGRAGSRDQMVEVDEMLRIGLGVELGEAVALTPIRVHHRRWLNYLIGRPFYVTCRVQHADPAAAEREVCLVDPLTLDLLGIDSGAEVVVEGRADENGDAAQIRLKALTATDAVRQRREEVYGGDFGSRFPSTRDALGQAHDIPWIYIDSAGRHFLGLGRQRLATVRMRPSRSFQVRQELREMLLILGLAFIGLTELVQDTWARLAMLGVMVGVVVAVISVRMRGRLIRRMVRPRRRQRQRRRA